MCTSLSHTHASGYSVRGTRSARVINTPDTTRNTLPPEYPITRQNSPSTRPVSLIHFSFMIQKLYHKNNNDLYTDNCECYHETVMVHKVIILKHGGGELANQLWNYMSIYAYGLERKIPVENPSFFEYHSFFRFLPNEKLPTKAFSIFFRKFRRRSHIINRVGRIKYALISRVIASLKSSCVFSSQNNTNTVTYLPPTSPLPQRFETCDHLYFTGWLFRNPKGLEKYRNELTAVFTPRGSTLTRIETIVGNLRKSGKKVIGVHIRQGDYKTFKGGVYWIDQARMREVMEEYMRENSLSPDTISFILTSDGPIDEKIFNGLSVTISREDAVTDLYLLSKTDVIIGSDSSFGHFASWYGNIPHIVATKSPIDWSYHKDKRTYFKNQYCTMIQL